ncbi:hypothetical protein ABPG77_000172 [Micractinium sp. CCAP 211/92]
MPRADQRLYAAFLRLGRAFEAERLPLVGATGGGPVCHSLAWRRCLRAAHEAPRVGDGLAEGARTLALLHQQLETLRLAEGRTRQALAEWAALSSRFGALLSGRASSGSPHLSGSGGDSGSPSAAASSLAGPFLAAAAAEEGLSLLSRQVQELADPLCFLEQELDSNSSSSSSGSGSGEPGAVTLDGLAAAVRQQHPALFGSSAADARGGGAAGGGAAARRLEQAAALADALYRQQRFKFEPFEWVYEGLSPLLLPERLLRRKLAPVTLATVAAGVARRLGLPLLPVPADAGEEIAAAVVEGPGGGAAAGGLPLDQLRPDVAQRYAGRAAAAPPTAGPWALLLDCSSGSSSPGSSTSSSSAAGVGGGSGGAAGGQAGRRWTHAMDACTGELVDVAGAAQRYPGLQLSAKWEQLAPLVGWQHMVRTVIQAHQRRGESDLVAHWVYVLLALDPHAAEWGHMLAGSSGGGRPGSAGR